MNDTYDLLSHTSTSKKRYHGDTPMGTHSYVYIGDLRVSRQRCQQYTLGVLP